MEHVKVNPMATSNVVNVMIDDIAECQIHTHTHEDKQLLGNFSIVDSFYTALGCTIADWTLNEIYDFVKCSSIFRPYELYTGEGNTEECDYNFEEHFFKFVSTFPLDVEQLIELLNNFLDSAPKEAYYKDTSILKALLSIQLNVNMLWMNFNDNNETQDEIFRIMTKEMTFVQSFMSMNCTKPTSNDHNPRAADFWITTTHQPKSRAYEYPFLYYSAILVNSKFYKDTMCLPTQIVLVDLLEHNDDKDFFSIIYHAEILIDNDYDENKSIPMREVEMRVRSLYDVDTVFWYQDMVIKTAVKTVFMEILNGFEEEGPSYLQQFTSPLWNIYKEIKDSTDFPDRLVAGIKILLTNIVRDDDDAPAMFDDLRNFHDSLMNIKLSARYLPSNRSEYLHAVLKKLLKNIDDMKCFKLHYDCLLVKNDRYYLPFVNAKTVVPREFEVERFTMVYDFLVVVYAMCDSVLSPIGDAENSDEWTWRAFGVLKDVRNYFLLILERRTTDAVLMQTAYDVASVLANVPLRRQDRGMNSLEIIRTFDVIMTILTALGMHYCTSSRPLCLLRIYLDSCNLDNAKFLSITIKTFFQTNIGQLSKGDLDESGRARDVNCDYLNVSQLYDNYVNASEVVNVYTPYVLFKWRGRDSTIREVFEDVMNFPFNPRFVFAVYDVYFNFYVAVVYYMMREVPVLVNLKIIQKAYNIISKRYTFNYAYLPVALAPFVSDIKSLLNFFRFSRFDDEQAIKDELVTHQNSIKLLLKLFNVIIHSPKDNALVKYLPDSSIASCSKDVFLKELSAMANPINRLFTMIAMAGPVLRFNCDVRVQRDP